MCKNDSISNTLGSVTNNSFTSILQYLIQKSSFGKTCHAKKKGDAAIPAGAHHPIGAVPSFFLRQQPVQRDRQLCFLRWWVLTSSDQLFSHISLDSPGKKEFRTWAVTRAMAASDKCGRGANSGSPQGRNTAETTSPSEDPAMSDHLKWAQQHFQTQRIQMERGTRSS